MKWNLWTCEYKQTLIDYHYLSLINGPSCANDIALRWSNEEQIKFDDHVSDFFQVMNTLSNFNFFEQ